MAKRDLFGDPALSPQLPSGEVVFGQVLGARYRLDEQLSVTDEIALWRGWDEQLARIVLVYVLPPNHPKTAEVLAAARVASAATDARFLRVLDALEYGPSEPVSFVVCECVPGYDLCDLLSVGPLGGKAATWLALECADAIAALHAEGHAHGHLDLAAVDITPRGTVRVSGFVLDHFASPGASTGADADADAAEPTAQASLAELQQRDVRGLGQILYAALTGSWPQLDDRAEVDLGLPVVRRRVRGLAPPSQLRSSIPAVLDVICVQILAPMPDNPPVNSAEDVVTMLQQVLGSADASEDLALRVQALVVAVEPEYEATASVNDEAGDRNTPTGLIPTGGRSLPIRVTPAPTTSVDEVLDEYESSLGRFTPVLGADDLSRVGSAGAGGERDYAQDYAWATSDSDGVDGSRVNSGTGGQQGGLGASALPGVPEFGSTSFLQNIALLKGVSAILLHRIIAGVIVVALVVLASLLFRSCSTDADPVLPPITPRGTELATVTYVVDFDPEVDGGSGGENWTTVENAIDDDLETLWYTETYEFPETSRRKPGTGLILGFDEATDLQSVAIWADNPGATIKIMVPSTAAATAADEPPLDTVASWRDASYVLETSADGEYSFTFEPGDPITTRWIMIYITVVPPVPDGYALGIREVSVHKFI
ncbi:MAG: protein kinase family protein [Propionibacteriaceae bacterium]|nr:protein kinase family protein [Propionibacteriaceae bacterium]